MGDALGGRPCDDSLYRHGVADYEAMAARPEYHAGLGRLLDAGRGRGFVSCVPNVSRWTATAVS